MKAIRPVRAMSTMERTGVFEAGGRWSYRCGECGAVGTPVETRVAARAAYRAHRRDDAAGVVAEEEATPDAVAILPKPVSKTPRRLVITTEQVQAMLERLRTGATMHDEAAQLGMTYNALRNMLEQLIGLDVYFTVMAEQRIKRCKLPPSKNFLVPETEKSA